MQPAESLQSRYEETPYRDQALPQFDLSRLLGLARLFQTPGPEVDPSELRVLDLCCASGRHLREQAARYPQARFTGVDFSHAEIEDGQRQASAAGLENLELIACDLLDFEVAPAGYDVVLCHGAFSWVPDEVKQRIFDVCRQGLAPRGVAAIAYLTYPGWKQREAFRELLASRVSGVAEPAERVRQSALLLRLLHEGYSAHEGDVHAASLKAVVESMQKAPSNAFLHDELGVEHDPCYFMQFAEWAADSGLQYLAEADLGSMAIGGLSATASPILQELAPDFLETQQLIDFIVNRSGRSSLLVRDDAPVARGLALERFCELDFTTEFRNTRPANAPDGTPDRFESLDGRTVRVDEAIEKQMVTRLSQAAPDPVHYSELVDGEDGASEALQRHLAALVSRGLVDARLPIPQSAGPL